MKYAVWTKKGEEFLHVVILRETNEKIPLFWGNDEKKQGTSDIFLAVIPASNVVFAEASEWND
jgi:hypothetical protein